MKLLNFSKLTQRSHLPKILVLCFLLLLVIIKAVPNYLSKKPAWAQPPNVTNLQQIREIKKAGLTIPDWPTIKQEIQPIGGHKWSIQILQKNEENQAILMLLPQNSHTDKPEVEWMDINGMQRWRTDSERQLEFTTGSSNKVTARFFRAWTQQQTYAVIQWYAWPQGGNPSPIQWFFNDQLAQWQQHRVPWIAVNIQVLIEPLGEIEKFQNQAESLAQSVQSALIKQIGL